MSHDHADEEKSPGAADAFPTAEDLRGVVEDISSHYPPPRLGTELVLLEVNPHRAHAYWNIDIEDYRAAQKRTGLEHAPLVLRLYDITDGTPPERALTAFDIEIQGLQGHWYVDLWKDGRTHVADLGFRDAAGRLIGLARSNPVSTPPADESAQYHTAAVDTTGPELRVTDLVLDPGLSGENMDLETGALLEDVPLGDRTPSAVPALPSPVRESPPQTVPFQPSLSGPSEVIPWPAAPAIPPPEKLHDEVQAYFERAAERSAATPSSAPWQGPSTSGGPAAYAPEKHEEPVDWPSAESLSRLVPAGSSQADLPAEPVIETPEAPALSPVPEAPQGSSPMSLDQYVGLSSFTHGRREVALEVNVELHIHGRAKPGTELTLYGQPIPLRPDGTFSIRKPLPQGAVVLPLLAVDPPAPEG